MTKLATVFTGIAYNLSQPFKPFNLTAAAEGWPCTTAAATPSGIPSKWELPCT